MSFTEAQSFQVDKIILVQLSGSMSVFWEGRSHDHE